MADRENRRNDRNRDEFDGLVKKTISINRVIKVVKGGRNQRFSALVVVGDQNGKIGLGTGKAAEVPDAIEKANKMAKSNLKQIAISGTTIPHMIKGKFGSGEVLLLPAEEGTGIIAGGPVRAVLEVSGIKDIRAKNYGTSNPINCAKATIQGLYALRNAEDFAKLRGVDVVEG